jgi:2-dehydro-3-deoxygluconokinase
MNKKIITFKEIIIRIATPDHQRFTQFTSFYASFGSGEANIAVSLTNFGYGLNF